MPGIVGYIDPRNSFEGDLLASMISAITHEEGYIAETYEDSPLRIGRSDLPSLNPEPQPFSKDELRIFFMGNITNKEELTESKSLENGSNAEIIAESFRNHGITLVTKVKGQFIAFIWNCKERSLIIINDRFGKYPLYYAKIGDQFLFSSELKALLLSKMVKKEINDQAIVDFIMYHHLIGDETFLQNVFLLPYASVLRFRSGVLEIDRYWDIRFSPFKGSKSPAEYAGELNILFEEAVKRAIGRNRGKVGIMLSGGLDSRNIAIHIPRDQLEVHTFTFGERGFIDVKLAEKVSKELGFEHHFIPLTSEFIRNLSEKTIFLMEGIGDIYTGWNLNALPYVEKERIDLLLEGSSGGLINTRIAGSLMKQAFFALPLINKFATKKLYDPLPKDELSVKVREHYDYYNNQLRLEKLSLEDLLSKEYYDKVKNLVGESLEKAVHKACEFHKTFNNALDYVYFTERHRRLYMNASNSFRWKVETLDPFLDYDLIDFMSNIPPELKLGRSIVKDELRTYHPELSHIPVKGGLASSMLGRIAKRIRISNVFPQIIDDFLSAYLRVEEDFVKEIILDERTLTRGIFNEENVKKIVFDHMSNRKDYAATIGMLISLELWFRLFVD